jgi:hypothetical protein
MAGEIDGLPLYLGHGFLTFSEAGGRAGWHPGSRPARWWRSGIGTSQGVDAERVEDDRRDADQQGGRALLRLVVAGWSATSIIWLRRRCCPAGSRAPREPMWLLDVGVGGWGDHQGQGRDDRPQVHDPAGRKQHGPEIRRRHGVAERSPLGQPGDRTDHQGEGADPAIQHRQGDPGSFHALAQLDGQVHQPGEGQQPDGDADGHLGRRATSPEVASTTARAVSNPPAATATSHSR